MLVVVTGISMLLIVGVLGWLAYLAYDDDEKGISAILVTFALIIFTSSFKFYADCAPKPPCTVTKQAYDIDQYEYVISGSQVEEQRSKDKKDLKGFLEQCSQIQRKQKWLEEHDEVETLMEVK